MKPQVLRKPASIVGRDAEWAELFRLHGSNRPELVFVLGRRRAGKSHVLSRFATAVGGVYFQAVNRSEHEQLLDFSRIIGATFADQALMRGVPFPDWRALFEYLADRASQKPLAIVIDEFPYLADAAPGFTSLIQRHWDHRWSRLPIKLILSGSHITAMQRIEAADQPLYGRRTARIQFHPFSYRHLGAFLPRYEPVVLLQAYGIFGGLPGNLSLLDPALDLGANVARLLLSPSGRLYDDAQHMLDAFLSNAAVHYSIIEAIARGERVWSRITSRVGRDGGALLRPSQWLQNMGLIRRVVPITESNATTSKRARYEISDPYLTFWHRCVAPLVSSGGVLTGDASALWRKVIAPQLDDYMGEVFEGVCRDFVAGGGIPHFEPQHTGRWWDASAANEIDIVATDLADQVLVAECKWGRVDAHDLATLRARTNVMARELQRAVSFRYVLFSGKKPTDRALLAEIGAGNVKWVGLDDLFVA